MLSTMRAVPPAPDARDSSTNNASFFPAPPSPFLCPCLCPRPAWTAQGGAAEEIAGPIAAVIGSTCSYAFHYVRRVFLQKHNALTKASIKAAEASGRFGEDSGDATPRPCKVRRISAIKLLRG